ncbi:ubiquinol-cytochrome-c reductase complex assembly factor 1 [Tachysurus ichikawai]
MKRPHGKCSELRTTFLMSIGHSDLRDGAQLHVQAIRQTVVMQGDNQNLLLLAFYFLSFGSRLPSSWVNRSIDAIQRKEGMRVMTETFYAAIFGYDEGILSDDCVLAAALWRNLFNKQCEDSRQLELMVEYVRKQMQFIDALDGEDLLLTGEVKWRPLVEENAQSILKVSSPTYNDAGL